MQPLDNQVAYWNGAGATKTFSHSLDFARLDALIARDARILDYGCGYGRVAEALHQHGYRAVEGIDTSAALIARGHALYPHLALRVFDAPTLPYADATFDAVMLFAVLTCIPDSSGQVALIAELTRMLRPGGILYISDLPLQRDARNQERYTAYATKYGVYGVFELSDGGIFRHHDMAWITALLAGFEIVAESRFEVTTMNNHPSDAFQVVARKR